MLVREPAPLQRLAAEHVAERAQRAAPPTPPPSRASASTSGRFSREEVVALERRRLVRGPGRGRRHGRILHPRGKCVHKDGNCKSDAVLAQVAAAALICLDPGHGTLPSVGVQREPIGPGSRVLKIKDGGGAPGEERVVLQIAFRTRALLVARGYRVAMTRTRGGYAAATSSARSSATAGARR